MSNASPAFQWYPRDILASLRVQEMSLAEEGAYRRLIDYCWLNGWVPADEKRAARVIGKGATAEVARTVLTMFVPHPSEPEKMIHERLEAERGKQGALSAQRAEAARARWNKPGKPADVRGEQANSTGNADAHANGMHMQCSSSSSSDKGERETAREGVGVDAKEAGLETCGTAAVPSATGREAGRLPAGWVGEDAAAAWGKWCEYLAELGGWKPVPLATMDGQRKRAAEIMKSHGQADAIEAINWSMEARLRVLAVKPVTNKDGHGRARANEPKKTVGEKDWGWKK